MAGYALSDITNTQGGLGGRDGKSSQPRPGLSRDKFNEKKMRLSLDDDESEEDDTFAAFADDEAFDPNVELPLWPPTKNKFYWTYLLFSEPLSSKAAQWTSLFILSAIMFSVMLFIVETLPRYQKANKRAAEQGSDAEVNHALNFFELSDVICMCLFTIEYFLRLIGSSGTPRHVLDRSLPMEVVIEDVEVDVDEIEEFINVPNHKDTNASSQPAMRPAHSLQHSGQIGLHRRTDSVLDTIIMKQSQKSQMQTTRVSVFTQDNIASKEEIFEMNALNEGRAPLTRAESTKKIEELYASIEAAPPVFDVKEFIKYELARPALNEDDPQNDRCVKCRECSLNWFLCCGCLRYGCGSICCRNFIAHTLNNCCISCNLCSYQWCRRWLTASHVDNPLFWRHIGSRCEKMWLFFKSPLNLVDFAVLIPFLIKVGQWMGGERDAMKEESTNSNSNNPSGSIIALRTFRLARMFRVLKLSKHTKAVNLFFKVLKRSSGPMSLLMFFLALCVVVFGSIAYNAEMGEYRSDMDCYARRNTLTSEWECSPFRDMFISFYWVLVTITTVGYGDMVPMSVVGRIVSIILMLVGVIGFAMPITVISTTFQEEYESLKTTAKDESLGIMHKVADWDVHTVCNWLANIGDGSLKKYVPMFRHEQITGDILDCLEDYHLIDLGFETIAERKRFKHAVKQLFSVKNVQTDPLSRIQSELAMVKGDLEHVIKMVKVTQKYIHKIDKYQATEVHTPSVLIDDDDIKGTKFTFADANRDSSGVAMNHESDYKNESKAKIKIDSDVNEDGLSFGGATRDGSTLDIDVATIINRNRRAKSARHLKESSDVHFLNRELKELSHVPSVWQLSAWKQHTV